MKTILLTLIFVFGVTEVYSQKEFNNWYFGYKAGITFNNSNGEPEALTDGQILTEEGCSSISNYQGKLLFYTDGITVWNKSHAVMKNGDSLLGHRSSTNSALIVPKPGSFGIYYIFTTGATASNPEKEQTGLNYSIVDMTLGNSSGAVTDKNIPILKGTTSERIAATVHSNGKDIWIISQDSRSKNFISYLLTENGLQNNPVLSPYNISLYYLNQLGQMKFSTDGKKLAFINYQPPSTIQIYDFNDSTGKLSNEIIINPKWQYLYGLEFSENGRFIYVTNLGEENSTKSYLLQYDISKPNINDILASENIISEKDGNVYGSLQMGPDRRIYLTNQEYLSVIKNSNAKGTSCNFIDKFIYLKGKNSVLGLPSVVQNYFTKNNFQDTITVCERDSVFLYTPYYANAEYQWNGPKDFKSSVYNPVLVSPDVSMSGDYKYSIKKEGNIITRDSIHVIINRKEKILFSGQKTMNICADSLVLTAVNNPVGCDITWKGIDSKENTVVIKESGSYTVYVENENGCKDSATVYVKLIDAPKLQISGKNLICKEENSILSPNFDFEEYLWSTGETTKEISVDKGGYYYLKTTNVNGCTDSAGFTVMQFGDKVSIYEKQHDFGVVKAGYKAEFKFTIENNEELDLSVKEIYIKNQPEHFELIHNKFPFIIKPNEKTEITVNFIPKFEINLADSVVVIFSEPCNITEYVTLFGKCEGNIQVDIWMPDTTADIGNANFKMPVYIKLHENGNAEFVTDISAKLSFLRTLYNAKSLSSGYYLVETLKDSVIYNVEFKDIIVSNKINNLAYFAGDILLSKENFTDMKFDKLEFSYPYFTINYKNGLIKLNEICIPEIKGIKIREGTFLSFKNDINGTQAKAYCGRAGKYSFTVYSLTGETIYKDSWTTNSKSEKYYNLSNLVNSSGLYFIILNSGNETDVKNVTIIK